MSTVKEIVKGCYNQSNISLPESRLEAYSKLDGLSLQNLYYVNNGKFSNCYMFTRSGRNDNYFDVVGCLKAFQKKYNDDIKFVKYCAYNLDSKEENIGISAVFEKENLYLRLERSVSETYILYGNDDEAELSNVIDILKENYISPEIEQNNLFLVAQDQTGYKLNKWHVKDVEDFDIDKQYNDELKDIDFTVREFIEEKDRSGLVILHGDKGTGKSTYIRHLINTHPKNKFVFIPSNLISMLAAPEFGNFLLSLSDSTIILEDCENVIRSRKSGMNSGTAVSLLLNLSDGLMSDNLGIKFICTFNEEIQNIDDALLRKGRLVCKYKFTNLNGDKTRALLSEVIEDKKNALVEKIEGTEDEDKKTRYQKKLDAISAIEEYTGKGMSLADIYNVDEESFTEKTKKIGFSNE